MGAEGIATGDDVSTESQASEPLILNPSSLRRTWVDFGKGPLRVTADLCWTPAFDPRSLVDHAGEKIAVDYGDRGERHLMWIRKAVPDGDGGVTLTLEETCEPVPATPYPDPIPREDQDSAHACCAPVRGAEIPADQVRTTRDTTGGTDDR